MKILQVIPYFIPAQAFGGPVTVASKISTALANRGHEVTVCTSDAKDFNSRLSGNSIELLDGVKVFRFKNLSMALVKTFKFCVTPSLVPFLEENLNQFDVIHLHEYFSYQNIVTCKYAIKFKIPYVVQAHGSLARVGSWKKLKFMYDKLFGSDILINASKVIALNETEVIQYKRMGVPDKKIVILPNGIDLHENALLPLKGIFKTKFNIPSSSKIILYLGRIHKTKGIDLLVMAYSYLINIMKMTDISLVIVGPDDGYLMTIKSLVNSLGVSNSVFFIGFISNEDKLSAFVDADVFVTPAFSGFPITFLESCEIGTPIITTTLGDKLDWIDGIVGYVTSPSIEELSKAIYSIISDHELRQKFSDSCLSIVKSRFSLDIIISDLEKLYEEV